MTNILAFPTVYVFTEIDGFDARKGYTKCPVPGIGARIEDGANAVADFWRNRAGHVVVRFASLGYRFSFEVMLADGGSVPDRRFQAFVDHVGELVHLWLIEGVDDIPTTELAPEKPIRARRFTIAEAAEIVAATDFSDPANRMSEEEFKRRSKDTTNEDRTIVVVPFGSASRKRTPPSGPH